MAEDINYIDDFYEKRIRPLYIPQDYGPLQVDQSKILLEGYKQGLEPQLAQQKALEESTASQIKAIGEMKSPQRSDLADAIMLLGAPLLGAIGGEAGALSAPKAYSGASDIYEKQIKSSQEKAAAQKKLGYERLEEDKKRLATLGTEIAKGRLSGGEKLAEMELEKYKQKEKTKRAEIMSAGQKAFDVESAKESAKWLQSGGYVSGKKDINVLDDALSQLSEGKVKSGGLVGLRSLAGKNIQDFTDSDWVTFESKIQSVFAGGLSKLLPGAITEKEREWFLSLSTNPRLSPEQNYELIKQKRDRLADILEAQKSVSEQVLTGTMAGYKMPPQATPAPPFQGKNKQVEDWAKENGYSYENAYKILKQRGAVK